MSGADDPAGFAHAGDGSRTGVVAGVTMLVLFEAVPLHLGLAPRWPWIAWPLTVMNVLTVAWLIADLRALGRRRMALADGVLRVRVGLRFAGDVPLDAIVALRTRDVATRAAARNVLRAVAKPATPSVLLELARPVRFAGPFGIRLTASAVALAPDERDRFIAALAGRGVPVDPA